MFQQIVQVLREEKAWWISALVFLVLALAALWLLPDLDTLIPPIYSIL